MMDHGPPLSHDPQYTTHKGFFFSYFYSLVEHSGDEITEERHRSMNSSIQRLDYLRRSQSDLHWFCTLLSMSITITSWNLTPLISIKSEQSHTALIPWRNKKKHKYLRASPFYPMCMGEERRSSCIHCVSIEITVAINIITMNVGCQFRSTQI